MLKPIFIGSSNERLTTGFWIGCCELSNYPSAYTFQRVSVAMGIKVEGYYWNGKRFVVPSARERRQDLKSSSLHSSSFILVLDRQPNGSLQSSKLTNAHAIHSFNFHPANWRQRAGCHSCAYQSKGLRRAELLRE